MDEERKRQLEQENQLLQAAASILSGILSHHIAGGSPAKPNCRQAMQAAIELSDLAAQYVEDDVMPDQADSTYDPE